MAPLSQTYPRRYKFMHADVLHRLREAVLEDVPGMYLTEPIVVALREAGEALQGHRSQLDRIEEKLDALWLDRRG